MPSLFSVSESDPGPTAKPKPCEKDAIVDLTMGDDTSDSASDSQPSKDPVNSKEPKETDTASSASAPVSTPNSKKRRVTPNDDSGSKQKQQKKVNQMTLSSFFFQRSDKAVNVSTPSKIVTETKTTKAVDLDRAEASTSTSTSTPAKVTAATNSPSPASPLENGATEKDSTGDHVKINLDTEMDKEMDQSEAKSKSLDLKPMDRVLTLEINPSPRKDEEKADLSSKEISTTSPETQPTSESSKNNAATVLSGSTIKKKTRARPAKSASNANGTRKKNAKKSSPQKAKESATDKITQSLESSATPVAKKKLSEEDLSEESCALLRNYRSMKNRYMERVRDVTERHKNGLSEEDLGSPKLEPISDETELKTNGAGHCEEFPTRVMTNMALLIEGSDLPLSQLVSKICSDLKGVHKMTWSIESVSAKIKLLSKRKAYFEPIKKSSDAVDLFENTDQDRLWRWEVMTLDLLSPDVVSQARKARAARKKISSYQSALLKLVKSLEETEKLILDPALPNLDKAKAKISRDEERVLKFERDAEKQRLAEEAKAKKLLEQAAKKKAREEALEEKRRKKEEEAEKKKEAAQARENEKRKKEEEKLQKEEEKKRQEKMKKEKAFKQKATFRSFFAAPKKEANDPKKKQINTCIDSNNESFDVELFRSKINASTNALDFSIKKQERSASALASRKRRAKMVVVSVYKTVTADDAEWGTPDYLEQTTITVPNKYRFLSFHEDCRPAYRGTWTKKSSIVTGKNPFGKESSIFDYEYDSEAEWEEGDDEMGENVEDETKNQDEDLDGEGNAKMYDFEDGFCVADDRLLDNEEDADEDTKALYKKKMLSREEEENMHSNRIRIIAPGFGGVPLHLAQRSDSTTDQVEGFGVDDVAGVLSSYKGIQLSNPKFCIDAFPQLHLDEKNRPESNTNGNANKDDYSAEAMVALARFSHHSTHNSKDKLIEELRTLHPTLFISRAKATRKLDAISIKRKHPKFAGVYWEVKSEILTELGLTDIMEKKVEDIIYDSSVPEKPSSTDELKSKKALEGSTDATKSKKANGENKKVSGKPSKKRKATKNANSEQKNGAKKTKKDAKTNKSSPAKKLKSDAKSKKSSPSSKSKSDGEKETPKKKDACAGMKSIMAQFVKRSPVKPAASSSKDPNESSSSQ